MNFQSSLKLLEIYHDLKEKTLDFILYEVNYYFPRLYNPGTILVNKHS